MRARNANLVILSIADLALLVAAGEGVAMVRQRTTSKVNAGCPAAAQCNATRGQPLTATSDKLVRQELLGIEGSLKRLVFVLDKSGSMSQGRKWGYTREVVDTWLRYLDVEQCALVIFDETVEVFPPGGAYLDLTGIDGAKNRDSLLARLVKVQPGGNTNTIAALRQAYDLNPTAIVFASDGFPDGGTNRFDFEMARSVVELCKMHGHSVPVHVLALGNYFQPRLGKFLWSIADVSGGSFIAR